MSDRVLYVCPLARLSGHPPFECTKETRIMKEHGIDVELLTFSGVSEAYVPQVNVIQVMPEFKLFRSMRSHYIAQWILRVFEYTSCILKAVIISGERPIYLRDAEPFPHFVHIINLFFRKKWVISSTGGLFTMTTSNQLYKTLLNLTLVYKRFWYRLGRNRITYSAQNKNTQTIMQGLVGDNVALVPLGHRLNRKQGYEQARNDLNVNGEMVLMNFGVSHSGKDNETIFKALTKVKDVVLLHAGASNQSLGESPTELIKQYPIKAIIKNYTIPEYMKYELFGACDWIMLSYKENFTSTPSMLWEACSYGIPVIASGDKELQDMVNHWQIGLTFESGNVKELREVIELAKRKDIHDKLAANCHNFISDYYSEDNWFNNTMRLLNG